MLETLKENKNNLDNVKENKTKKTTWRQEKFVMF